ncbi:flagellar basal body-associated FliL family protein [Aquisalinus flavus]|uniref:Flagellar protein FliL n=1 Tax=Aquisalinus flavus TaxID=1526572 RepID=A0A8J2Y8A5_9PROT|nr:flagellar basal body-associated FliL family protein [Aquisalinus flavus]MBD0425248.1 flagellar basal body-associated FliL family protein [Aquisalinus flavus]UNE49095.1 flagellar basal body-associated FliL family protein [Aquisalinus flavus]GGD17564.1 hypothetical protein GCM10011342_27970 [Aquisalinus flavus]
MADTETEDKNKPAEPAGKKGGGLMTQLVLAVVLGCTAFGTVWFMPARSGGTAECAPVGDVKSTATLLPELALSEITFIEMEPMIVTLGEDASARNLRIGITLETAKADQESILFAQPKLRDAFTGYLRALEVSDIEDPNSIIRLRAQLQRRAEVILGNQSVRGVLITDFVIR